MTPFRSIPAPVALVVLMLPLGCGQGGGGNGTSALLLTLDTTRRDAISAYGAPGRFTPAVDRLAVQGVLFEAAYSVAPLTLPSHASMLTGLVPLRHSVRDNDFWAVPDSATTLAELASDADIDTAAFLAAAVLAPSFGLDQGFATYDMPAEAAKLQGQHYVERPARAVVDATLRWFEAHDATRPFFVWCHFYDPHAPYRPRSVELRGRFKDAPYTAEVVEMDQEIGRLLAYMEVKGLLARTTVLAVADHGEAFGEHDETGHGANVYQTTMHVPLLLRLPPNAEGAPPGTRRNDIVSVVDVLPTLADALGLPTPEGLDGVSLLAPPVPGRGAYFESYGALFSFGYSHIAGWLDPTGKYVHSSTPQFFDLGQDPGEEHDLATDRPAEVEAHRAAIQRLAGLPRLIPDRTRGPAPAELEALRALGYAGLGATEGDAPEPLDPSERPSPPAMAAFHGEALAAIELVRGGYWAEGAQALQALLQRHPRAPALLENLSVALLQLQRWEEAISPLEGLIAERPRMALPRYNLGVCYWAMNRPEEAIAAVRSALELEPDARYVDTLALFLEETGRASEAEKMRALLQLPPER